MRGDGRLASSEKGNFTSSRDTLIVNSRQLELQRIQLESHWPPPLPTRRPIDASRKPCPSVKQRRTPEPMSESTSCRQPCDWSNAHAPKFKFWSSEKLERQLLPSAAAHCSSAATHSSVQKIPSCSGGSGFCRAGQVIKGEYRPQPAKLGKVCKAASPSGHCRFCCSVAHLLSRASFPESLPARNMLVLATFAALIGSGIAQQIHTGGVSSCA